MVEFSFAEYSRIVDHFKTIICDYEDAAGRDQFAILRHDIEFSMADAVSIAHLDSRAGVSSTFFVQVLNGSYNPLSKENRRRIAEIQELGHHVGLHLYVSHLAENDLVGLEAEIANQRRTLEIVAGRIDRFSFHRPPRWSLTVREDIICGLTNAYGPSYFEFSPKPNSIKYYADSCHRWSYGHPLDPSLFKKFQILLHPDEWSELGGDAETNFQRLFFQHEQEFRAVVSTECKHFAVVNSRGAGDI